MQMAVTLGVSRIVIIPLKSTWELIDILAIIMDRRRKKTEKQIEMKKKYIKKRIK